MDVAELPLIFSDRLRFDVPPQIYAYIRAIPVQQGGPAHGKFQRTSREVHAEHGYEIPNLLS